MTAIEIPLVYGAKLIIEIDAYDVLDMLAVKEELLKYPGALLQQWAGALRKTLSENFAEGGRPTWAPIRPSTIARKNAAGLPARTKAGNIPKRLMQKGGFGGANSVLIASGALRDSYVQKGAKGHVERIDEKAGSVEVGSNLKTAKGAPYAVYLDRGSGAYSIPNAFGRGRTIRHPGYPARPQTLPDEDIEALRQMMQKYLSGEASAATGAGDAA